MEENFWHKPTLLWFMPRLGLNTETGMELLCLTGMLLSLLAMALKSWRDSITFFVLWFLYYSLYQVKQSICRKAVCYGRLSFPSNNSIDCEKMAFNDGSFFSFYFIPPCKLMILKLYQLSYNFVYSYDQFNGDIVIKDIAIWVNKDILYMYCFLWIIRNSFLSNLGWTNICLLSVVSYIQIFNIPSVATKNHIDVIHFKFVFFSPSHFH